MFSRSGTVTRSDGKILPADCKALRTYLKIYEAENFFFLQWKTFLTESRKDSAAAQRVFQSFQKFCQPEKVFVPGVKVFPSDVKFLTSAETFLQHVKKLFKPLEKVFPVRRKNFEPLERIFHLQEKVCQ